MPLEKSFVFSQLEGLWPLTSASHFTTSGSMNTFKTHGKCSKFNNVKIGRFPK